MAVAGVPSISSAERPEGLSRWVASCLGVAEVELREFRGGAGNAGYQVFVDGDDPVPKAFLRTALHPTGSSRLGYSLQREGVILRVAEGLGFPVAPVLGTLADPDALLMGFVSGSARPDPAEVDKVAGKYLTLIAAVHAADVTAFPVTQHATLHGAVAADLAAWELEAADRGVATLPLIALGARVLKERVPAGEGPPCLVHGDVGPGNFLALDGEVTAILDWELAHLGDPHEDLAWLWMRGAHTNFGDPEARFAEYETASGIGIDRPRLAWHVAFVMWKSVIALHGRLGVARPGELAMVQLVVGLTYDALLGAQLVNLLGGSPLLGQSPLRETTVEANLAEELLGVAALEDDQRVVVEYLREAAALGPWLRSELDRDCALTLGVPPSGLLAHVRTCPAEQLLDAAQVLGRAADRQAATSPKSVRRIERAQRIGLGAR